MKKKLTIFAIVVVIVSLIFFVYWKFFTQHDKKVEYVLGNVTRGDIVSTIDATGTIQPVNRVDLSTVLSGTLEKVMVKQNDYVTKGQVLATVFSRGIGDAFHQAQNTLINKESYYNRMQKLYDENAISLQALENAKLDYLNSKALYEKAKTDMDETEIVAPIDGYVIGEPMKEGTTLSQGLSSQMVIMTIADFSSMRIELLVDETDIGLVKIGQYVEFTVDAYPGKIFHGKVSDISRKEKQKTGAAAAVVHYTVYVDVDDNDKDGLYPSMTARASIRGNENKNALKVPVTAIRSDVNGSYVYKQSGKTLEKVYITTGLTSETEIEILSGLAENDKIVVSGVVEQEKTEVSAKEKVGHPGK